RADHHPRAAGRYQQPQDVGVDPHNAFMLVALLCQLEHCAGFWVVKEPDVCVTRTALGPKSLQGFELPLELVLRPAIVRVQESDPLSPRFGDSLVPCRAHTLVGLEVIADSIAINLLEDLPGVVR